MNAADVKRRYGRERQRAIAAGRWEFSVAPKVVAEHVRRLRDSGMSVRSIAAAAGVSHSTVACLAWPNHSEARVRHVQATTARALLAVRGPQQTPPEGLVPAVGTARRVRALAAMGWSAREVGRVAGLPHTTISGITSARRIKRATADIVERAYDELSMRPGPCRKARARALAAGWPPPLAWDDETIDDPAAVPTFGTRDDDRPDDAVVARVLDRGESCATSTTDREALVPLLAARGVSDPEAARLLRTTTETVRRTRERLGVQSRWSA